MKTTLKLLTLVLLISFSSCNKAVKIDYKYSENLKMLACDFPSGDLYKEAVYSFENDIINNYDMKFRNPTKSYSNFLNLMTRGSLDVTELASGHSLKIAKALKAEKELWIKNNSVNTLNTSSPLMDCIAKNIKDKDIKATFNALLSTNSLEPKFILPLLSNNSRGIQTDGSLKTYIALEMYYSKLLDVDLNQLKNPDLQPLPAPAKQVNENVDFNSVNLRK